MSKRIACTSLVAGYVKSGQAQLWRPSSHHSDNKSPLYLKHIQISYLILWEDAAKLTASVFSSLPKELATVPPSFKCICSQIFSQVFKADFTHLENTCLVLNSRTQRKVCRLVQTKKHMMFILTASNVNFSVATCCLVLCLVFCPFVCSSECDLWAVNKPRPSSCCPSHR